MHDLVFVLIIVICRSDEFTTFAGSLVNHFSERVLCLVAVLGVDVAKQHVSVRAWIDDTERRASVISSKCLRLAIFNALKGIRDEQLLQRFQSHACVLLDEIGGAGRVHLDQDPLVVRIIKCNLVPQSHKNDSI